MASHEATWSDVCGLDDLAVASTGFTAYSQQLDLGEQWPARWTTTWKVGRTSVVHAVRDLAEVDVSQCTPVRRFTWRTDQYHRPGLEYLVTTDRHHGFESFEEERLLLVTDFAAGLVEALSQPFRLRLRAGGRRVEHTPDYLLLTDSGPYLVDVRPADRIRSADALKFAATAEVALAAGWNYSVVTGWRRYALGTVDALSAERRDLPDVLGTQGQLIEAVAHEPMPFGDLVGQCRYPAIARAHASHLMWHRYMGVDLSGPYGDWSLVRLAERGRRWGRER
ncbi:TnsA-like heteromeric transposase endonuclease subunit [Streptomyces lunaelactis]|uniref:TnsA-like heteromeric transposase endonuclease subunit n=1 Tax=Streptomyces lunaelactis TaxID=1535768 RepID=UPI00211D50DE|nr:TnsA-like heteromeric transposase endonuclease subunit [Streptomyces lunaelactis]